MICCCALAGTVACEACQNRKAQNVMGWHPAPNVPYAVYDSYTKIKPSLSPAEERRIYQKLLSVRIVKMEHDLEELKKELKSDS